MLTLAWQRTQTPIISLQMVVIIYVSRRIWCRKCQKAVMPIICTSAGRCLILCSHLTPRTWTTQYNTTSTRNTYQIVSIFCMLPNIGWSLQTTTAFSCGVIQFLGVIHGIRRRRWRQRIDRARHTSRKRRYQTRDWGGIDLQLSLRCSPSDPYSPPSRICSDQPCSTNNNKKNLFGWVSTFKLHRVHFRVKFQVTWLPARWNCVRPNLAADLARKFCSFTYLILVHY